MFAELCASAAAPALLHGNVLTAIREPRLAIDPKGVVGERAYEAGALLRNTSQVRRAVPRRGSQLAS